MPNSRDKTIGESFQAQTKYRRGALPPKTGKVVSPFKVYANPLEVASLPVPELASGKGLWAALSTTREGIPEGGRLRQSDVSQLLWATSGFTYGGQRTHATRRTDGGFGNLFDRPADRRRVSRRLPLHTRASTP